jgi:predicted CXXCH cytochrome family protein
MRTEPKALRRSAALVATVAAALFMGTMPAYADNGPHVSKAINAATPGVQVTDLSPGRCSSCHRAHTAQAAYLLTMDQEQLCFSCHGDGLGATTDVKNGVSYSAPGTADKAVVGALRGGGFVKAALGTNQATKEIYWNTSRSSWSSQNQKVPVLYDLAGAIAPQDTTSNHLGGNNIMWGNGAISATANPGKPLSGSSVLECGSCHDPHGNGQYRILKAVPSDSDFKTVIPTLNADGTTTPGTTPGIFIKDTANKDYTTTNYWVAGDTQAAKDTGTNILLQGTSTTDPTPKPVALKDKAGNPIMVSSFQANVAAWCTTCHTRYLAPSGSWGKTSGDKIFTYRHTGDNVSGDAASNRNCIQCHVAHGTNASMAINSSVEFPGSTVKVPDSRLLRVDNRGTCLMCHNV